MRDKQTNKLVSKYLLPLLFHGIQTNLPLGVITTPLGWENIPGWCASLFIVCRTLPPGIIHELSETCDHLGQSC